MKNGYPELGDYTEADAWGVYLATEEKLPLPAAKKDILRQFSNDTLRAVALTSYQLANR